jgi:hypothetical protein
MMKQRDLATDAALGLAWSERIANYECVMRLPSHLKYQAGWVTGTWWPGNNYRKRIPYHGAYPGNLLGRIGALFADRGAAAPLLRHGGHRGVSW